MPARTYQVSVGTTPTLLWWYAADRTAIVLRNDSGFDVFHSPDGGLTISNGARLPSGTSRSWSKPLGDEVNFPRYGIVISGSATVSIEEEIDVDY